MKTSAVIAGLVAGAAQISTGFAAAINLQARATGAFSLYAYGEGLTGLSVFSQGEDVFIGDYTLKKDASAAPVVFTMEADADSGNKLVANPESSVTRSWSNRTLAIPKGSTHTVTLADGSNPPSDVSTNKFILYGAYVMATTDAGSIVDTWYTTATETEGVYKLNWEPSGDTTGQVRVSLKTEAP